MSRTFLCLVVSTMLLFLSGCSNKLNDDWLALNKTQCAITDKLIEFETSHMNVIKGLMDKHFTMLEQEIRIREKEQFLDPRTVIVDGVPRIMVADKKGQPAAVSRVDVEKFVKEATEARTLLAQKRREWDKMFSDWEKLLADVKSSNDLSLKTAEDIHTALNSAQRSLEDITKIVGTLTASTAMFFLTG